LTLEQVSEKQARRSLTTRLFRRAAGARDERTRSRILDEVVLVNLGVAEALARRYQGRGIDEEDLQQVACEALVKAVRRFDPGQGTDFLSFAVPTIRGELQRHFRDVGWVVRPTRGVQEIQSRVMQADERLAQQLGRSATREEVAEALGISLELYDEAMSAFGCFQPSSLDQSVGDTSSVLGDLLVAETHDLEAADARVVLAPVLRRLDDQERRILYLRFCEDLTQEEIGRQLGVTQTRVSRILSGILTELREELARS
jgi:RNA polymerase sigma-B factor